MPLPRKIARDEKKTEGFQYGDPVLVIAVQNETSVDTGVCKDEDGNPIWESEGGERVFKDSDGNFPDDSQLRYLSNFVQYVKTLSMETMTLKVDEEPPTFFEIRRLSAEEMRIASLKGAAAKDRHAGGANAEQLGMNYYAYRTGARCLDEGAFVSPGTQNEIGMHVMRYSHYKVDLDWRINGKGTWSDDTGKFYSPES